MKRILLGISVLLILVQNSFATTDAEFDKAIKYCKDTPALAQLFKCEKAVSHSQAADVNECLKSIKNIEAGLTLGFLQIEKQKYLAESYLNAGVIYSHKGDKLNAYKYYMQAAKLGDIRAQRNLNIICKESPWTCK